MNQQTPKQFAREAHEAIELLGDFHPLLEQLGYAEGLVTFEMASVVLLKKKVGNIMSLKDFLSAAVQRILFHGEFPAIREAYFHTKHNRTRELIQADNDLAANIRFKAFQIASKRIGQYLMKRLRPLRDQRIVQRYLTAVEQNTANGWHTMVYGITLEIYSLPLRQGLINFAHQSIKGFIYFASRRIQIPESEQSILLSNFLDQAVYEVDQLLKPDEIAGQVQ